MRHPPFLACVWLSLVGLFAGCSTIQKGPFFSEVTYANGDIYILTGDETRTTSSLMPRHGSDKPWTWPSRRDLRVVRQADNAVILDGLKESTLLPGGLIHSQYDYFPAVNLVVSTTVSSSSFPPRRLVEWTPASEGTLSWRL